MKTRNSKRKNLDSKKVSRGKKTKLDEVFPIDTIANPTHIIVITKSAEFELFRGSKEVPFSRNFECELRSNYDFPQFWIFS